MAKKKEKAKIALRITKDKCPRCGRKGGLRFSSYARHTLVCNYCGGKFNRYKKA